MQYKTKAIVLKYIKYKETSIIAKIFTESFGLQSFIINGVRKPKAKNNMALFQPLTLLDMVVYYKGKKHTLLRASEIKVSQPLQSLYFDIKKSSIAMFVSEVLNKSLFEGEENANLYTFSQEAIAYLDQSEQVDNFSIQFLIHIAHHLGFFPKDVQDIYEQLYESNHLKDHPNQMVREIILLQELCDASLTDLIPSKNGIRSRLVDHLLLYFDLHLESFGKIHSLDILREVLK